MQAKFFLMESDGKYEVVTCSMVKNQLIVAPKSGDKIVISILPLSIQLVQPTTLKLAAAQ